MRNIVLLIAWASCLASCDYFFKDRSDEKVEVKTNENVVLGNVKDENGCVTTAGYKWSLISKACIRPFEEGYRLNSIEKLEGESMAKSVFVVFEEDGNLAELFLPDNEKSILLKSEKKGGPYTDGHWVLQPGNGYSLKKDGVLFYAGAAIEEGQITGDDKIES
jgi:hypothetical protein